MTEELLSHDWQSIWLTVAFIFDETLACFSIHADKVFDLLQLGLDTSLTSLPSATIKDAQYVYILKRATIAGETLHTPALLAIAPHGRELA